MKYFSEQTKPILNFLVILVQTIALVSCADLERENELDPKAINYNGGVGGSSSSRGGDIKLPNVNSSSSDNETSSSSSEAETPSSGSGNLIYCRINDFCQEFSIEACMAFSGTPVNDCSVVPSSSSADVNDDSSGSNSSSSSDSGDLTYCIIGGTCPDAEIPVGTCLSIGGTPVESCPIVPSSSSDVSSSSNDEISSSSRDEVSSSSSSVSSSSETFSSSSNIVSSSSSVESPPISSSSEAEPPPSSSSVAPSSSSISEGGDLCEGFVDGTEREHYGKNKPQFCDERDGKKYVYAAIGSQTWMAENLNYAHSDSKCYSNLESNCDIYGRLYNWSTAMGGSASSTANPSGVSGVCPAGWHLPSQAEWDALAATTIQSEQSCSNCDAKYLKATSGWNEDGNGTDSYGFAALPGGYGYSDGDFYYAGDFGYWWGSSESDASLACLRYMSYDNEDANWNYYNKAYLFSVRCVED